MKSIIILKAFGSRSMNILSSFFWSVCRPENIASSTLPFMWHSVDFLIWNSLLPLTFNSSTSLNGYICWIFSFSRSQAFYSAYIANLSFSKSWICTFSSFFWFSKTWRSSMSFRSRSSRPAIYVSLSFRIVFSFSISTSTFYLLVLKAWILWLRPALHDFISSTISS